MRYSTAYNCRDATLSMITWQIYRPRDPHREGERILSRGARGRADRYVTRSVAIVSRGFGFTGHDPILRVANVWLTGFPRGRLGT